MTRTSRAMLALAVVAGIVFTAWPQIDLAVARHFYVDGPDRFPLARNLVVNGVYEAITYIMRVAIPALVLAVGLSFVPRLVRLRAERQRLLFVLVALAVGPGMVVSWGFKDNWGRARPAQVTEFGGEKRFTPALVPTDQCDTNCSFVSGHVATAFFPAALGLIFARQRRTWLAVGVAGGALGGFSRMASGSHFLSDVVFAMVIVWFTSVAVYRLLYRGEAASRARERQPVPGAS